jgi:small subunit ribosomal protein S8
MITDPVANMFARIKNAITRRKETVRISGSGFKKRILDILKKERYILDYKIEPVNDYKYDFVVYLKYYKGKSVINDLIKISKPGRRIYASYDNIPLVFKGIGTTIVSTSKGVMSHKQAYKEKVGGEVIGYIY